VRSISGTFDEAFATLEVLTIGLWLAALALRTFRLSSRHRGSFDEACPTLEAGASGLWRATLVSYTF